MFSTGHLTSGTVTINGANTVVTVTNAGLYLISFGFNTTSVRAACGLRVNGVAPPRELIAAASVTNIMICYSVALSLAANTTLEVLNSNASGNITIGPGTGGSAPGGLVAFLTVVRVQ